jgi:hypothetical protein
MPYIAPIWCQFLKKVEIRTPPLKFFVARPLQASNGVVRAWPARMRRRMAAGVGSQGAKGKAKAQC